MTRRAVAARRPSMRPVATRPTRPVRNPETACMTPTLPDARPRGCPRHAAGWEPRPLGAADDERRPPHGRAPHGRARRRQRPQRGGRAARRPAASIQVLRGRVRVTALGEGDTELGAGELRVLTHERHAVSALEDSAFLLTTVTSV